MCHDCEMARGLAHGSLDALPGSVRALEEALPGLAAGRLEVGREDVAELRVRTAPQLSEVALAKRVGELDARVRRIREQLRGRPRARVVAAEDLRDPQLLQAASEETRLPTPTLGERRIGPLHDALRIRSRLCVSDQEDRHGALRGAAQALFSSCSTAVLRSFRLSILPEAMRGSLASCSQRWAGTLKRAM